MDGARPQSLVIVVSYHCDARLFSSVIQLDSKVADHEYVAHFQHPQGYPPIRWAFSQLGSSTELELCLLPDWSPIDRRNRDPLHGFIYNLRTKLCKAIEPPCGPNLHKHVVALGGHIYIMGTPGFMDDIKEAFFGRFDRHMYSWETLKLFPYESTRKYRSDACIGLVLASVVWNDTIFLNMDGCGMWAYVVDKNEWYPVVDEDNLCNNIVGRGVVLGNIIYFLTNVAELVVALSIKREQISDDLVFECSLCSKITVPGMNEIRFNQCNTWWRTRDLVYLGKGNFCIVRSCKSYDSVEYQPIQLTNLKLKGDNSMTVTNICVHEIELLQNQQFEVQLCFPPPEDKADALKERERFLVNLNPFPTGLDPKPFQEEEIVTPHNNSSHKGHSIYVRRLPSDATVEQLVEGLEIFGPIKRDGIQLGENGKGECFAYVEFENATSKQRAIEASTIRIVGCLAEIVEESRIGFTRVEYIHRKRGWWVALPVSEKLGCSSLMSPSDDRNSEPSDDRNGSDDSEPSDDWNGSYDSEPSDDPDGSDDSD